MAGPQRITVLQHISHEASKGEKWQVNDVANISNKLLMSSFYASVDNKIYVSIYSAERQEVQEMHNIEISTQTEPHAVLLTKDGNTIVVCVGMNIQFYKVGNGKILNTVVLQKEPSCICRWKDVLLVATGNSSTIQTFYFNAFQTKQLVLQGLDQSDYPTDMTMVGDVIYLCTKKYGQALSYDQYGVKLSAYKRNDEQTSKANSIAVHREKRLVFILWNKCNVLVYSHLSNEILFSVDTTCSTKVRLNDDYMMITKVPANNEVLIYDVETLIDFAVLKKEFLATLKKKARDEILTDRKPHDPCQNQTSTKSSDQSVFKRTYSVRKQKKRQQQKKLLKLFDELQIKYANDNAKQETTGGLAEQVQTETPTDFAMLKKEYRKTLREIKPHQQNMLKLFDELQKKYKNYNTNTETKERQLHESKTAESALEKSEKTKLAPEKEIEEKDTRLLEEERKIEGQKTSLLSSSEMIKEEEDMSTELKGQQKIPKEILEQVKEKSTREERSSDQVWKERFCTSL